MFEAILGWFKSQPKKSATEAPQSQHQLTDTGDDDAPGLIWPWGSSDGASDSNTCDTSSSGDGGDGGSCGGD
jgi:hypothetical protein